MFRSRHRITKFALRPPLRAMTPAKSKLFCVRSRCSKELDSGKNSARAMAPAEDNCVEDKNNRLRALLRVKAVRSDCIWSIFSNLYLHGHGFGLTPSKPGPQQGFLLMSSVSSEVLYFCSGNHQCKIRGSFENAYQRFRNGNKRLNIQLVLT
jgi:hypothetical protein